MFIEMGSHWKSHIFLVGMLKGKATLECNLTLSYKVENTLIV